MGTINGLLKSLDNKVPNSIAKRLDGLAKLNEKLAIAKEEHQKNPTKESEEALDEISEFLNDTQEDLEEDLSTLVEEKRNLERQASQERANQEAKARKEASDLRARKEASQARAIREANERRVIEERKKRDLEKKQLEEKNLELDEKTESKTEKKSGIGWGSLLLGGALLVLTGGAVKFFGNKR